MSNKPVRNKPTDFEILTDLFAGKIEEEQLSERQLDRYRRVKAA